MQQKGTHVVPIKGRVNTSHPRENGKRQKAALRALVPERVWVCTC